MIRLEVPTPEAMEALGRRIGGRLRAGDLLVLVGELGAGKTTLARGIGEGMGVRGPITSPTFVLSRVHPPLAGGAPLLHVDAYRLAGPRELDDLDLDFAGSAAVVEWGDGLLDGVAESWLRVEIERPTGDAGAPGATRDAGPGAAGDDEPIAPRIVRIEPHGPRWDAAALEELA